MVSGKKGKPTQPTRAAEVPREGRGGAEGLPSTIAEQKNKQILSIQLGFIASFFFLRGNCVKNPAICNNFFL